MTREEKWNEKVLEDVQWCKGFKYNTPVHMAETILLSYAERFDTDEEILHEWLLERVKHWARVKQALLDE